VGYRIPEDDRVLEAAKAVLAREGEVESQRALARLVRQELQVEEPAFRVGAARVRQIVLDADIAELTVKTGTTTEPPPERCPVCGAELEQSRNRTLTGQETVISTRCPACPYRSGVRREVPLRYGFRYRENGPDPAEKGPF
jgi:DNA repair exonuclease SbcCD ATPase subunit